MNEEPQDPSPYESPKEQEQDAGPDDSPQLPSVSTGEYTYRHCAQISAIFRGALLGAAILALASLWVWYEERSLLESAIGGTPLHRAEVDRARSEVDGWMVGVLSARNGWSPFVFILACVWTYRVNSNARAFGARGMRFTPGAAVGWLFVPILNVLLLYQIVREVFQASHDPENWQSARIPAVVPLAWALCLFVVCASLVGLFFLDEKRIDGAGKAINTLDFARDIAVVLAALVLGAAIDRVQSAQTETFLRLTGSTERSDEPPHAGDEDNAVRR